MKMRQTFCAGIVVAGLALSGLASARGCLAGAAAGGAVGHVAGHHALLGAAVGCAVNHHRDAVKDKKKAALAGQVPIAPRPRPTPKAAPAPTPTR